MENENKSGIGIAIILGAIILFAFDAKADVPRGTQEILVWADECPDNNFRYDLKCKKKIFIDKTISEKEISFEDFQKIADEVWKKKETWKQKFRKNFIKKYGEL